MTGNPFPGLRAFKQEETKLFFGRDGQSKELLKRLQESRFLALVGVSGSGKSSLVKAGLLPALEGGLMSAVDSDWRVAVFRPGNNPIGNMARALVTEAGLGGESGFEDVEAAIAETTLRRGNLGLLELLKQAKRKLRPNGRPRLGNNENILLVVDQFEEIFRIIEQYDELVRVKQLSEANSAAASTTENDGFDRHPREEASAFVKLLLDSTTKKGNKYDENLYIIVTMRSDYLGETAQFLGMPERINDGQYLIPRMSRDERRQAIVGPVAVGKGAIAEPLVNQLLNDAGENPGHLPILQHALMRMWDLAGPASQSNGGLNLDHYDKIGKLSGALSQHANEAFEELSPEHQDLAAKVFKCLTEKGLANREIRRPMTIADISVVVGANETDVKAIVECFRQDGRWFLMPPSSVKLESDTLVDISHESLISGWDKLSKWVNEEAESARTYKRLADTAILKERNAEEFYRGPALQLALKWREENAPNAAWARRYHPEFTKAITFLDDSRLDTQRREKAEKDRVAKELRRQRTYNIILGVLTVVIAGLGLFTYAFQRQRVATETKLKDDALAQRTKAIEATGKAQAAEQLARVAENHALDEEKKAREAADRLQISYDNEKALLRAANEAKATAIAERDKARRLQAENAEQTTIYGYFKRASDNLAGGSREAAVESLREALHHFEQKEKKPLSAPERRENKTNRISTHINIADVYRNSTDLDDNQVAVKEYDQALELMDDSDDNLAAPTLLKAGSVWAKSKIEEQGVKAAGYYEEAAEIFSKSDKKTDAVKAWITAGRILAKFPGENSDNRARKDFSEALKVRGNDKKLIAITNTAIGESYLEVLQEQSSADDDDEAKSEPDEAGNRENRTAAVMRANREAAEDKLREAGANYFLDSAKTYESLKDLKKAAEMQRRRGAILGGSDSYTLLNQADQAFQEAAVLYDRAGQASEQRDVLFEAGRVFAESRSGAGERLAEKTFESILKISEKSEAEKAATLKEIAQSYASSSHPDNKTKAVDYLHKSAVIYKMLDKKAEQVDVLIQAGNILRAFKDGTSKPVIEGLDLEVISVYNGDLPNQAKILNRLGDAYASSDEPAQREKALQYYRQATDVAHEAGDKRQQVNSLLDAGRILVEGDTEKEAKRTFDEAVKVYEGNVREQAATLSSIGLIYIIKEPAPWTDLALEYYDRAIALARKNSDRAVEVDAILLKAKGLDRLDDDEHQPAITELYRQAIAVYDNDPANQIETAITIGRTVAGPSKDAERLELAKPYFDKAVAVATNQPDKKILAGAHLEIGQVYALRDRKKAMEHLNIALTLYETEGDLYGQAMALYRLATTTTKNEEYVNRGLTLFEQVLPKVEASGNKKELADAFYAMAALYRRRRDYEETLDYYNRALEIYEKLPGQTLRAINTRNLIRNLQRQLDRSPR
ncbi:MAG TPA: hypothetical protein VFT08_06750 [Pyrinomonadaceae bacterium]|nr:hypothetical protein [Pyrinomonadaceae bacterium]